MRRTTVLACLGLGALLVPFLAGPVGATELISISVDQIIYGDEGDEILVASADVPPELVGLSCEMTGESFNQDSVHEGNDLLIDLAGQVRVLPNFEDERDISHIFRDIAELPARIDVYVRLGPDGVSSGGFLISIECDEVPPTTTSTSTTTSTTTTSTTTTTTTTVPSTTVPTTTEPLDTVAPSTSAPTTTIDIAGPTSTSLPSAALSSTSLPPAVVAQETPDPPSGSGQLAVTGAGVAGLAVLGFGLFALGVLALGQGVRLRSRA